jgi:hypothetical protein
VASRCRSVVPTKLGTQVNCQPENDTVLIPGSVSFIDELGLIHIWKKANGSKLDCSIRHAHATNRLLMVKRRKGGCLPANLTARYDSFYSSFLHPSFSKNDEHIMKQENPFDYIPYNTLIDTSRNSSFSMHICKPMTRHLLWTSSDDGSASRLAKADDHHIQYIYIDHVRPWFIKAPRNLDS